MDAVAVSRGSSPGASGAFASPATLLVGIALLRLGLHLHPHVVDLLGFDPQPLEQLFTGLLVAAEPAESRTVGMLLPAIDAESHDAPSDDGRFRLI